MLFELRTDIINKLTVFFILVSIVTSITRLPGSNLKGVHLFNLKLFAIKCQHKTGVIQLYRRNF